MLIIRRKLYSNYKAVDEINSKFPNDKEDLSEEEVGSLNEIIETSDDPNIIDAAIRKIKGTLPNPKNTKRTQVITTGLGNKN